MLASLSSSLHVMNYLCRNSREPTASIPSYIDMDMNQGKRSFADKRYVKFLQNDLYLYSKKMYEGLLRMAQDSSSLRKRMHFIAFRYT